MMFSSKMNLPFLSFYLIQEVNETNGRVRKGVSSSAYSYAYAVAFSSASSDADASVSSA